MSDPNESSMSLIAHLKELRTRIMWCLLAFVIGSSILLPFSKRILFILFEPVRLSLVKHGQEATLQFTAAQEYFFAMFRVSLLGGLAMVFPVIIYQIWAFISPGLYKKEKNAVLPFMFASPVMFIIGASFAQYYVTPMTMDFFISFSDFVPKLSSLVTGLPAAAPDSESIKFVFQGKVSEVLDLTLKFVFAFGICFQLPIVLTLLGMVGLITSAGLKTTRRYAVVAIMIVAAVITPSPDIGSQLILFIAVYGLYEISIWLVRWVEPKYEDEEDGEEAPSA